jgi:hypothetical protein
MVSSNECAAFLRLGFAAAPPRRSTNDMTLIKHPVVHRIVIHSADIDGEKLSEIVETTGQRCANLSAPLSVPRPAPDAAISPIDTKVEFHLDKR